MNSNLIKLMFLFLVIGGYSNNAIGQSSWSNWKPLYSNGEIQVEIRLYEPKKNSCAPNGKKLKYKYRVKGAYKKSQYYLNWHMDYIDCNGDLIRQSNAVEIGKNKYVDISNWKSVESLEFSFIGRSIEGIGSTFDELPYEIIKRENIAPELSTPASAITAPSKVYMGQNINLKVQGGMLGIGAKWIWYRDKCGSGGTKIGEGPSIRDKFFDDAKIFVLAKGKNNTTKCTNITINVDKNSLKPDSISGRRNICIGESTMLVVSGGNLGLGAKWVWYEDACSGIKLGEGTSINVKPIKNARYFVRAEGTLNTTLCEEINVKVNNASTNPKSIKASVSKICIGETVKLDVVSGKLGEDAEWKWYADDCSGDAFDKGSSVTVSPNKTTTYYVRGQGVCNSTDCISVKISVEPRLVKPEIATVPRTIYKGKKINLRLTNGYKFDADVKLNWYKGGCDSGIFVGEGQSIKIKPKEYATYYVKAVNKCYETTCDKVSVNPIRLHIATPYYTDSRKYLHYGIGAGMEWKRINVPSTFFSSSSVSSENINIQGLGIPLELTFRPIFKEHFSLGISVLGAAGVAPSLLDEGKHTNNNGRNAEERLYYLRWKFGGDFAIGLKSIKLLIRYNNTTQSIDYTSIANSSNSNKENFYFKDKIYREDVGFGFRIGNYLRTDQNEGRIIDLLYTFTQETNSNLIDLDVGRLFNSIHGLSLIWWKQSGAKFNIDFTSSNAIDPFTDLKNSSIYVGLTYNWDRFY